MSSNTLTSSSINTNSSVNGAVEYPYGTDWYRISFNTGTTYRIDLEGSPTNEGTLSDTYIRGIYNSRGQLIQSSRNDDGGLGYNSQLDFTPESSGIYYISAGAYSTHTGTYQLSVSSTEDDATSNTSTLSSLSTNSSVDGKIESAHDTDWYRVTLTAGTSYQIDLEGSDTKEGTLKDTYLRGIYDSQGKLIQGTTNDDGGTGYNSKLDFTPTSSGTYFISAGAFSAYTGTYQLSFSSKVAETTQTNSTSNINLGMGTLSTSATQGVSAVLSGTYWTINSAREITYSFNESIPNDYYNYSGTSLTSNWKTLTNAQKSVISSIFTQLESYLDINFTKINDTSSDSDGDIQFNVINMSSDTAAFAFYPGRNPKSGDVFLSNKFNTDTDTYSIDSGEGGLYTIIHEIGHALGLSHTFGHSSSLTTSQDDVNHSVMSYTNNNNYIFEFTHTDTTISSVQKKLYPSLFSLYDIAALQSIYGVNDTTSTQNNTYTYSYSDYTIRTLWDAGGIDTIDLSATTGDTVLDLSPGSLNSIDKHSVSDIIQLYQNTVNDNGKYDSYISKTISDASQKNGIYTGLNNLGIATGTIIENVRTGSGDDVITDNLVNNIIQTFSGNDKIYLGNGGNDSVDGGSGTDSLYIDLNQSAVTISTVQSDGSYNLTANNFSVNFTGIESIVYNDVVQFIT